jgi:hypothetical protein
MNPERQRIAIAEACGWRLLTNNRWTTPHGKYGDIPDYLNDLNAMHEAEKVLKSEAECARFARELALMVKGFAHDPFLGVKSYIWHATAAQRAEAFLRTIGKWEDGK